MSVCQRWRLRPPVMERQHVRGYYNRRHWPWRTHALVTVRSSLVEVAGNVRRQFVVCGDGGTVGLIA